MPENPLFINGIQQLREYDWNTHMPEMVLSPNQTVNLSNFALFYTGCGCPDHGKMYLNNSQTGKPVISIEWGQVVDMSKLQYSLALDIKNVNTGEQLLHDIYDRDYRYIEAWGISKYKNLGFGEGWHYYLGNFNASYFSNGKREGDGYMNGSSPTGNMRWRLYGGNNIEFTNNRENKTSTFDASWWTLHPFKYQAIFDDYMGVITKDSAEEEDTPEKITDTSDLDPKGGNGTETNRSDDVDYPNNTNDINSNCSSVNAGFISLWKPTMSQLQSLSNFLWTSDWVDNLKKLFGDPMDCIISIMAYPFNVSSGGSASVKAGYIDTDITMEGITAQFQDFNLGTISYGSYWGNALDFDPYTKVQIYLPFIGFRSLNVNDVINTTMSLHYRVDLLSGSCVAWLKCANTIRYEWSGHVGSQIPVNAANYRGMLSSAIGIATSLGVGIVAGVAGGGAIAGGAIANGISQAASGVASGNAKPTIERSGSMGGSMSLMGMLQPFLLFQRPKTSLPANYNYNYGYASNKYLKLGNCKGFTQVEHMHLQVQGATDDEMKEIEIILHKGVFI